MGTTSEKLTYLNNTKQLLKDKINNLGGSIDDNTTFRQYAEELQDIYDNLPKTEYQEGTEVNLGVTIKGKLDYDNGVVGIGQTEQDTTQGYQLLDTSSSTQPITSQGITISPNGDGTFRVYGTASANVNFIIAKYTFTSGNKYTMTNGLTDNQYGKYTLLMGTYAQWGQNTLIDGEYRTFTAGTSEEFNILIQVYSGTTLNVVMKPLMYSGEYSSSKTFEQYTGGQASPSPNWEQEVKCVAGRNKLKVDFEAVNVNGIDFSSSDEEITIKGTTTASANTIVGQVTLPKGNYTLSCTNMAYAWGTSRIEVSGTGIDTLSFFSGTLVRQLSLSQETALTFRAIVSGVGTSVNYKTKIQVEEGNVANKWLPYNTIEIVESGKNEIPFPYYDSDVQDRNGVNWSVNENGTINANGTANASSSIFYLANGDNDIYLEPGTYKISTNLFTDANGFSIQAISIVNGNYGTVYWNDMVLTERTRLRVRIIAKPNATVNVQNAYMMIEPGSTATDYEPYHTPITYPISLGNNKFYKIGDYADELLYDVDEDKVYKNEKIGKKIFTGASDENWAIWQGIILIDDTTIKNLGTNNTNLLLNYFQASTNIAFIGSATGQRLHIQLSNAGLSEITNVSAWRTWLSTHNLEFVYVCNETQIEITDTTLHQQVKNWYYSQSFNGTTILESNGDLPMIIKVRALKGE